MSTTTTTRSQSVILKELNAARAKLRELTTAAEADDAKRRKQEARIDHARRKWQLERPGEPFDPESSYPPLVPHQIDADLHQRHHRQHYIIADLEAELAGRGGLNPLGA